MSLDAPSDADDVVFGASLAAGVANVIMQLSRPGVGHGVVESKVDSGKVTLHPLKRARTTFTYLAVAMWGDEDDRRAYRTAVNGSHRPVRSDEDSPVEYNAFDTELQLWVAACLYHGLEDVYRALYPRSGFRGQHGIYERAHTLGTTLQVRPDQWPADRDAYDVYWKEGLEQVAIDDTVREYLTRLTDLAFLPRPIGTVFGPVNRFFTTGFLPERFREEMRFSWSDRQQARFDRTMAAVGAVNRVLPAPVRHFPYNLCFADFRRRRRRGLPLV